MTIPPAAATERIAAMFDRLAEQERAAVDTSKSHSENGEHRGAARAWAEAARLLRATIQRGDIA
ncbi:MAG: hypothetical protein KGL39_30335 [Patescibacteria group bacterium]|nr:hypothetical protein [Patescibacteria group bacterium]